MSDLSELIKECCPLASVKSVNYEALAMSRRLGDLGFDYLAHQLRDRVLMAQKLEEIKAEGYITVTPAKINQFLERKAAEYNENAMKTYSTNVSALNRGTTVQWTTFPQTFSSGSLSSTFFLDAIGNRMPHNIRFTARTNDFLSPDKDRISGFAWEEVPVKEYKAIPPDHALEALKRAREKEIFHDFTIASVTHVKDPLLFGVLNGVEDRFFLAQWGEDVALDDVI